MVRVHIHLARHIRSDRLRITGQHDDLIHTMTAHLVQCFFHLRTNRILDANDANELCITCDVEEIFPGDRSTELLSVLDAALL